MRSVVAKLKKLSRMRRAEKFRFVKRAQQGGEYEGKVAEQNKER